MDFYGYVFEDNWYDIGSFESYDEVNEDFAQGRLRFSARHSKKKKT